MPTDELLAAYWTSGDARLREEVVLRYMPLVKATVARLAVALPPDMETQDLVDEGVIGLIQAVDRFDPGHGVAFGTYAQLRVRGAIIDALRSADPLSRTARARVRRGETPWLDTPGRGSAIAARGADISAVGSAALTLEHPIPVDDDMVPLAETLVDPASPDPAALAEQSELRETVFAAVERLPERERALIWMYYHHHLSFRAIAERLGVSESRACQIHAQALRHLRQAARQTPALAAFQQPPAYAA